jgi:hypothetical protein
VCVKGWRPEREPRDSHTAIDGDGAPELRLSLSGRLTPMDTGSIRPRRSKSLRGSSRDFVTSLALAHDASLRAAAASPEIAQSAQNERPQVEEIDDPPEMKARGGLHSQEIHGPEQQDPNDRVCQMPAGWSGNHEQIETYS